MTDGTVSGLQSPSASSAARSPCVCIGKEEKMRQSRENVQTQECVYFAGACEKECVFVSSPVTVNQHSSLLGSSAALGGRFTPHGRACLTHHILVVTLSTVP